MAEEGVIVTALMFTDLRGLECGFVSDCASKLKFTGTWYLRELINYGS